jgi:hypothetical protein
MRWGIGYPLEAIGEAVRSSVRWGIIVFAVVLVGGWLGVSIASRQVAGVEAGFAPMVMASLTCVMYFPSAIAVLVAILAWYLPVHFESPLFAIVAAIATLLVWAVLVALCAPLQAMPF